MDIIEFVINRDTQYPYIDILINNVRLIDMLKAFEMPFAVKENHPNIAGSYAGLSARTSDFNSRLFLGEPEPLYGCLGKTTVLVCGDCGEPGCWPFLVKIEVNAEIVTWSSFEQPYRDSWLYDAFGPFVFTRKQYEKALENLAGNIK